MAWDGSMFGYAPGVDYGAAPPVTAPPATPAGPVTGPTSGGGPQQPPTMTTQQLLQFLQQTLGNAGGAQGNHGNFGGVAGNGVGGNAGTGQGGQPAGWNWGPNQGINLGSLGAGALQASTMLPKVGTLAGLAQLLMRGYNTANADAVRSSLGGSNLDIGQILGSLLGLNNYGTLAGNQTFFNNQQGPPSYGGVPTAVTQGGMYDAGFLGGGPFGLFSDMRSAYTAPEANLHKQLQAASASPVPAGYVAYNGPLSGLPAGVLWKNGQAYVQAGGGNYGNSSMPGGNFAGGQGAPGTVAGGQYGNQDTGGMAGPVNRSDPALGGTGMLSRI